MKSLENFSKFVEELNQSNSRNYKINVLTKYKDDEDVKYYLDFIFNPYITTGIGKKSYERFHRDGCIDFYPTNIFHSTRDALEYLKEHNTGDDNTRELMFSYYMTLCCFDIKILAETKTKPQYNLHDLFYNIITKNLILGIDTLTINKCIPNLIPQFNVQLANKYFDKPEIVEGKYFALTTKIDGGRIIALKENGEVSFWTRAGQKYEGLVDLEEEMKEKLPDNLCLDGEITLLNPDNLTSKDQYKQTMKIVRKDGIKHGIKMLVFDCMTAEEFRNQSCKDAYFIRRDNLISIFNEYYLEDCIKDGERFDRETLKDYPYYPKDKDEYANHLFEFKQNAIRFLNTKYTYFNILPILYQGSDTSEIIKWLNYNIEHGEEGVMINILDGLYEFKRTDALLKVKRMNDIDLPIIGYYEGEDSFKGMLGGFIFDYKGNELRAGSGLKKDFRKEAWKHPEDYLGLTASIQYFEETTNANGGESLRFPVFLSLRFDK